MRPNTILTDVEALRAMLLDFPVPIPPERLAAILFVLQEITDLAYELEQSSARPSLLNHWIMYRWN